MGISILDSFGIAVCLSILTLVIDKSRENQTWKMYWRDFGDSIIPLVAFLCFLLFWVFSASLILAIKDL